MYQISVTNEDIEKLPLTAFGGQITVVDRFGGTYNRALAYLRKQKMIGIDTESKPVFEPHQHSHGVALLQLSGPDEAFLFRVKKIGLKKGLADILGDPNILKIGAAVGDDIRRLKRDFGFDPKSFVDLQTMVWEWGIKDKSVKKMAANILGIKISKTQQLSNWEAERLSEAQQKYAATDAWVCLEMYKMLMSTEKNPLTPEQMMPNPPRVAPAPADAAPTDGNAAAGSQASPEKKKRKRHRSEASRKRYYQRRREKRKAARKNSNVKDHIEEGA